MWTGKELGPGQSKKLKEAAQIKPTFIWLKLSMSFLKNAKLLKCISNTVNEKQKSMFSSWLIYLACKVCTEKLCNLLNTRRVYTAVHTRAHSCTSAQEGEISHLPVAPVEDCKLRACWAFHITLLPPSTCSSSRFTHEKTAKSHF